MNVLFVDLDREWRGGQSQIWLTMRGVQGLGHQVRLLAVENASIATRAAEIPVPVHHIRQSVARLAAARAIRQLLANHNFDLIHLNEPHALTAAWLARAHKRVPLVLSRRIGFPLQKNLISQARYRAVSRFIANSKNVAQSLTDSGIASERMAIVNEGVDIPSLPSPEQRRAARQHYGIRDNEFLFGCVSVFVPEKGQRHLIEAMPVVRKLHPNVRLLLAGDGVCRGELESLATQLGQTEAVYFPGFVNNVAQIYEALDAFVFPSQFEGLGTALQSAMAAGLPSISTVRGALQEVVDPERTALVAEPNGREFAAGMIRLVGDEGLRRKLSAAGREEVQNRFSAGLMVENTIRVYKDVLAKKYI